MLTKLILVIISQHIHTSNYYVAHPKPIQWIYQLNLNLKKKLTQSYINLSENKVLVSLASEHKVELIK